MSAREKSIEGLSRREKSALQQTKSVYRRNNPENPQDLTDWDRVHSMTEEEIEHNALADPDALPFEDDWEDAIVVYPTPR